MAGLQSDRHQRCISSVIQNFGLYRIFHSCVVIELEYWASGGLRANRISPWGPPKPTLHIWLDVSMHAGGVHTDNGLQFQSN